MSDFYLGARYPFIVPTVITREDADDARLAAEKIKKLVMGLLVKKPGVSP